MLQVLLDGTLLHASLAAQQTDVESAVNKLLGRSRVFVTQCVRHELKGLGKDFAGTLRASRELPCHKCGCVTPKRGSDCLAHVVGANNPGHFFVGTNDRDLRKKLGRIPEAPMLFRTVNGLQLQPPTRESEAQGEKVQEKGRALGKKEKELLSLEGGEGPKKKRRGAKGPNPLSVKKRKANSQKQRPAPAEEVTKKKRVRKSRVQPLAQEA